MTFRELLAGLQAADQTGANLDTEVFGCDGDRNAFWAGSLELDQEGRPFLSGTDEVGV